LARHRAKATAKDRKARAPKHQRVHEQLRREILEGIYPGGSRLPTETELPRLFRVGKQTVVRALNELVREGLVIRRRGDGSYVADRKRPPLYAGRHLRLGILWPRSVFPERLVTEFWGGMTRGALDAWGVDLSKGEWPRVGERETTKGMWTSVPTGVTVECVGESVYSRERHPELEVISAGRFDGLLSLSIIEESWLEQLLALNIPTVIVDFPNERFRTRADQVYVDALPGYRAAVKHFADRGFRRIHYVGALVHVAAPSKDMKPEDVIAYQAGKQRVDPDSLLRLSAWRMGMDECGLAAPEAWVHYEFHGHEARLAEKILALPPDQRPEAVVCHGVNQAERLMKEFSDRGTVVRGAGATALGYGGPAVPITVDSTELGRTAAELLVWKLHQPRRLALRAGVPMTLGNHPTQPASAETRPVLR